MFAKSESYFSAAPKEVVVDFAQVGAYLSIARQNLAFQRPDRPWVIVQRESDVRLGRSAFASLALRLLGWLVLDVEGLIAALALIDPKGQKVIQRFLLHFLVARKRESLYILR